MIPISASQLLSLPKGASPNVNQRLPWPDGTLLSAKLTPTDTVGVAYLVLGSLRLRAKVPQLTPMGNAWLQLINHEIPAQFRLLSDAQAVKVLSQMLHKSTTEHPRNPTAKNSPDNSWTKLDTDFLPFTPDISENGKNLLLRDREDGNPHVILNQTANTGHFHIQGRLDLDHIGSLIFTLEGGDERNWQIRMFTDNTAALPYLRTSFDTWLSKKQPKFTSLDGKLLSGLPNDLSVMANDIQA